jgi:hypothetical protein
LENGQIWLFRFFVGMLFVWALYEENYILSSEKSVFLNHGGEQDLDVTLIVPNIDSPWCPVGGPATRAALGIHPQFMYVFGFPFNFQLLFSFLFWSPSQGEFDKLRQIAPNYANASRDFPIVTLGHRRMARGGHGLPKVSPGLTMPNPYTPCRRATPETALCPFQGWPAHRDGPPTGRAACSRLLPLWTPHAVGLCSR